MFLSVIKIIYVPLRVFIFYFKTFFFNIGKMEKQYSVHNLWKNGVEEDEAFLKTFKRKYLIL